MHLEVSHQVNVHNLVVISYWDRLASWSKLVSNDLTQIVLIIGESQVQITYISFIVLRKK